MQPEPGVIVGAEAGSCRPGTPKPGPDLMTSSTTHVCLQRKYTSRTPRNIQRRYVLVSPAVGSFLLRTGVRADFVVLDADQVTRLLQPQAPCMTNFFIGAEECPTRTCTFRVVSWSIRYFKAPT